MAGTVYIDNKGDRDPDYTIQTLINDRFQDIAHYTRYNDNFTIREGVTIIWPGGFLTPPKDSPDCGWSNELCEEKGGKTYAWTDKLIFTSRSEQIKRLSYKRAEEWSQHTCFFFAV